MAHHSITVNGAGSSQQQSSSQVGRSRGSSSSARQFEKKSNNGLKNTLKFINVTSSLNFGGAISMMGAGPAMAISTANTVANTVKKGVNLYATIREAQTGETMRYQNLKTRTGFITNPIGFAKQSLWDYGYLARERISRENQKLQYDRQLTGDVIHSRIYQRGSF